MLRRFAVVAALCLAFAGCATASEPKSPPRIVAVGDMHGDLGAWRAITEDAGLVDKRGRWIGGDAVLVQLGDIPDRGPDTRAIITDLKKLEKEATRKGGRAVALIGNHEAMNMTGDLRYTTPAEFAAFKTPKSKALRDAYFRSHEAELKAHYGADLDSAAVRKAFEAEIPLGYLEHRIAWGGTGEIGKWVLGHKAVVKIGDTLFVHGGLSDAYAARAIDDIDAEVKAALDGSGPATILTDEKGPLWYRGEAQETPEGAAEVDRVLSAFDAKRIVIGHTPQLKGVRFLYDGKIVAADTGASSYYGGVRGWVEIIGGEARAHIVGAGGNE